MADERSQIRQRINATAVHSLTVDSGGVATKIVKLDVVCQKLTFQAPAGLDATVEVAVLGNGPFASAGSLTGGAMLSYSTHLITHVKITATSGSGVVTIIGV